MNQPHEDVVRVASGELVTIELFQQALTEAGIEARVVGDALEGGLGTALQNSIELYVKQSEFERAREILQRFESEAHHPEKR